MDNILIEEYNKLKKAQADFEQDIIDTNKALEDSKLDYMARQELMADILEDNRQLSMIDARIKAIEEIARENNIVLVEPVKKEIK